MIRFFNDKHLPHNLFWTQGTRGGRRALNVFVFPREQMGDKFGSFNVASLEQSGYVVVGSKYFRLPRYIRFYIFD